ncbi:glutamine--fructose-6-phosphate transaminase (isomerizing) [Treponema pallidum]|uniref:Glutamine--fructose-6-phosphate aminotransferase [isomerizing] n=2 Tax=Treponema pallidum subsp. pallidum TaxID=161 RepID=GLMS_TREPA|nr:glutamine--fructose-6-phosphate transaminase (isomerizing) [Treponema pallidum]O83833.3 RecName: Full=Glutamine--fructose-6-phosphate aminotransferase [isomerizing]; AltName: Full=D-fructose-6-phosphate amidotransferase; AltName: Full=GFAT; AltName: Full=Glucosamine-6-phosphate synthase; AltName: Full=Hexosephosphate aminotransferase; AltName: Full=L-glutamine--D-fructose-6-phosphate amidotransferase [Treponema pallidum subsp. pallidum str. Nichols]AAC65824.1 glucosamine-fructose-6-phosphate a
MCGIVGMVAGRDVSGLLLEGLRRLEYRGYDSAGIAVVGSDCALRLLRCEGRVQSLCALLGQSPLCGTMGIAHTRWATHGKPCAANAHPHCSESVAIVHNGIVENHRSLREMLVTRGYFFHSQTDSEVLAHLLHWELRYTAHLLLAVKKVLTQVRGTYGLLCMDAASPGRLIAARSGSPLAVGLGCGENFVTSDPLALAHVTQRFLYLEEGDIADVHRDSVCVHDAQGNVVARPVVTYQMQLCTQDKGTHRHHMHQEIWQQPHAIRHTLNAYMSFSSSSRAQVRTFGEDRVLDGTSCKTFERLFRRITRVRIIACGTSYHAGLVARYWFEAFAGVGCQVEIASEYRYRTSVVHAREIVLTISQSGETADTIAALRLAKTQGYLCAIAICNGARSTLVRESDAVLLTHAGSEIGVASTKSFTTQLVCLLVLTRMIAQAKKILTQEPEDALSAALQRLPQDVEHVLECEADVARCARHFVHAQHALFLGRGELYPIAIESALKLKEISYIHAEAYAAGELKHGPLALVDAQMPVVAIAPASPGVLFEKMASNIEEVRARGGMLYIFTDVPERFGPVCTPEADAPEGACSQIVTVPSVSPLTAPIFYAVPLQLLAYHIALLKGTDIDQPRNLAKSVTVE